MKCRSGTGGFKDFVYGMCESYCNHIGKRFVDMKINGEIERMYLYSYGIREGQKYSVVYLSNSKIEQAMSVKSLNTK